MEAPIDELLKVYGIDPVDVTIKPLGEGHIHDTYLVERNGPPLVLQRMNHQVFKDIPLLMKNMELVTGHISHKNRRADRNPAEHGILLIESEGGRSWIGDSETGYWRMFWYIENQHVYDVAADDSLAYEGGKAIGQFHEMLSDLDPSIIGESIPGFHDFQLRKKQFDHAVLHASASRLDRAGEMINFARTHMDRVEALYRISREKGIPVRLTHNDTKFNNLLFDNSGRVTCLIDLDTVMPGYSWFDFGDALRSCASKVSEEEQDLSKIGFRMGIFESFAKGYLETATFLTSAEVGILHQAPMAFAFMQGMRFLTDYLGNDIYYKTSRKEHNLDRTGNQFALVKELLKMEDRLAIMIANNKERIVGERGQDRK